MITNLAQHLRGRVFAFRVESILLHHFFFLLLSCLFFSSFPLLVVFIVCFLRCIFVSVFDFEKEKGFGDHHLVIKRKAIVCFVSFSNSYLLFFFKIKENKGLATRCREIELYLNEETVLYDITLG